jgi:hypothetical protein
MVVNSNDCHSGSKHDIGTKFDLRTYPTACVDETVLVGNKVATDMRFRRDVDSGMNILQDVLPYLISVPLPSKYFVE